MNDKTNTNIKLSHFYGIPFFNKFRKEGMIDISIENIFNRLNETELDNKTHLSNKKATKIFKPIITLSDKIINTKNTNLNLLNKNQYNLNISNSKNNKDLNKELKKFNLNESKLILMNEQQYIRLISPFNFKLANVNNHIYTFTNKSYKQINKNLYNLYIICKSAFLNMSSIISKPIISNYPNLIKITLFYY